MSFGMGLAHRLETYPNANAAIASLYQLLRKWLSFNSNLDCTTMTISSIHLLSLRGNEIMFRWLGLLVRVAHSSPIKGVSLQTPDTEIHD